ncbi:MAG: CpaF family protein [Roseicyclus sp.]|jgi:pilus assembly protein CpaF|nr:CpaF family protein [Roseicyclus sp.]
MPVFGKKRRDADPTGGGPQAAPPAPDVVAFAPVEAPSGTEGAARPGIESRYRDTKAAVFARLIELLDPSALLRLDVEQGRALLARLISEVITGDRMQVAASEERALLNEIADDMLGYGPLERLLVDPDVSEIMVNGPGPIHVERNGLLSRSAVQFDDADQLLNVCQRIVSLVGRRVDEASPICDARLQDGSRVNVVLPPIALDGPVLTIRRFRRDRITLKEMEQRGAITGPGAELLRIIAATRCNVMIVGGTGSGKTTLLNVLSSQVSGGDRIVTCEDTAELQLEQPHVVRMETRPPNIEGEGEITMRDLVRNALRMRPDRIIVGEVRGPEAFDLMQAMNTGHDGSMGTLHANSPEEAITRMTSLITMGYPSLQAEMIRAMFVSAVDILVQVERLRDGARKVTRIAEVEGHGRAGAEDEIRLRPLMHYEVGGVDPHSGAARTGRHVLVNAPSEAFIQRARYHGESDRLARLLRGRAGPDGDDPRTEEMHGA